MKIQTKNDDTLGTSENASKKPAKLNQQPNDISLGAIGAKLSSEPRTHGGNQPGKKYKVHNNQERNQTTHDREGNEGSKFFGRFVELMTDLGLHNLIPNAILFALFILCHQPFYSANTFRNIRRQGREILLQNLTLLSPIAIALLKNELDMAIRWRISCFARKHFLPHVGRLYAEYRDRMKCVPHADFMMLIQHLKGYTRSKYSKLLMHWLIVCAALGLRRIEVKSMKLVYGPESEDSDVGRILLGVVSAKKRKPDEDEEVRWFDISHCSAEVLASVQYMSEKCKEWKSDKKFETAYEGCKKLQNKICNDLGLPNYSFYSLRHQFVNNMFATKSHEQTRRLAGHDDVSNTLKYFVANSAWDEDEIPHVETVDKEFVKSKGLHRLQEIN